MQMREKLTQKQQIDDDESDEFIDFPGSALGPFTPGRIDTREPA